MSAGSAVPPWFLLPFVLFGICLANVMNRKLYEKAKLNAKTLSSLLECPSVTEKRSIFGSYVSVSGHYRGRKVFLSYDLQSRGRAEDGPYMEISGQQPKKTGLFIVDYPRPTANTKLVNNKVYYDPRGSIFTMEKVTPINLSKFQSILDELSSAAAKAESEAQLQK